VSQGPSSCQRWYRRAVFREKFDPFREIENNHPSRHGNFKVVKGNESRDSGSRSRKNLSRSLRRGEYRRESRDPSSENSLDGAREDAFSKPVEKKWKDNVNRFLSSMYLKPILKVVLVKEASQKKIEEKK